MIQTESTHQSSPSKPYSEALSQRMKGDKCFSCNNLGHWAIDCPNKSSPSKSPPPSSPVASSLPVVRCQCGAGACVVKTSTTPRNPDRKFYACPDKKKCGFFEWCDKVSAPMCRCHAGRCSINVEEKPPNKGRTYFACRIRKGHGACDFFQWADEEENVPNGETNDALGKMEVDPTVMDHNKKSPTVTVAHEELCIDDILNSKKLDEKLSNLSPEHVEDTCVSGPEETNLSPISLSEDVSEEEASSLDVIEEKALRRCHESSSAEIHRRQKEFLSQMVAAGNSLNGGRDMVNMFLGIVGWCGQLDFPPSRCIADPPPKPFYCCIFPSFSPISNLDQINLDASTNRGKNLISLSCPSVTMVSDPSSVLSGEKESQVVPEAAQLPNEITIQTLNGSEILENQVIGARYMEVFKQAASRIETEFITQLESADFVDAKHMEQQATKCFHALDHLPVDNQLFKEHVLEYIRCASTLAELERSISIETSLQELTEQCSGKKRHFDEIASIHSETMNDYSLCEDKIQALRKDHSRLKEMLSQIEHMLCDYEAKSVELEGRLTDICHEMEEARKSLERVLQEKAVAANTLQQREMNRIAARAKLEKVKTELRKLNV